MVFRNRTGRGLTDYQLTAVAIGKDGEPFVLKDYSVLKILSVPVVLDDGSVKVFFTGRRTDADRAGSAAFSFDVKTHAVEPLAVPDRHTPLLVFRGGKSMVTSRHVRRGDPPTTVDAFFVTKPGADPEEIYSDDMPSPTPEVRTSRDGAVVLIARRPLGTPLGAPEWPVVKLIDAASKAVTEPKGLPAKERVVHVALSPDGKRIAYAAIAHDGDSATKVYVAAANGADAKVIYTVKATVPMVAAFDWR
jgi:hypothetical protein